jgi:hypothetical protein
MTTNTRLSGGLVALGTTLLLAVPASAQRSPTDTAITSRRASRLADSVLALMTLDEKLGQLTQAPAGWGPTGPTVDAAGELLVREGKLGSILSLWGADATRRMQSIAVRESRLRIPLLFGYDVIHGMRTIFPVPLAMAASFDSAAAARAAGIAAVEATAMGVHWTFAPMVDIARDARWGRIVEGAGEDPYLGSVMAAAQVRGFQGDKLATPTSLLATAKHFAAYGGAEAGRDYNIVSVSERDLWNVYLPPFHAAVRAGVGSFMASFNEINGTPSHANDWLLTDVLRAHWNFRGMVVSDWSGVWELMNHGIAAFLGVEHGNALADVLTGDFAPSGKLPVTFPRNTGQVPIYYNHKNTGRPGVERQKYTSNYIDAPLTPLFPFGHGLSYTTFEYASLRVLRDTVRGTDSAVVTVDLTNTGTRAGTDVAQLYLRDDAATVTRHPSGARATRLQARDATAG